VSADHEELVIDDDDGWTDQDPPELWGPSV